MKYRTEIDGLRALAVIPVILFHAGFSMFSGGFVGVDIFFVISGYLITTILIEDIEKKRFSILNFYARRARRILPALFCVMLCTLPFAWMWMLPSQLKDFSESLIAVSLFISNILFLIESGYFADAATEKPLLHTWSLAVEEQYYVLFPLFLIIAWRFGKNTVFWLIAAFSVGSLALSEIVQRIEPAANFYLAPTRAWELFAGSICAFRIQKHGLQNNQTLALLALTAILFSIFAYTEETPFPGLYALLPVMGTSLLILYANKDTYVAKLLSLKAFVGIGLISYSAYLWHQPLFAFAKLRLHEDPSDLLMIALSLASIALAFLSWKFIEQPFRTPRALAVRPRKTLTAAVFGLIAFSLIGGVGIWKNGFYSRMTYQPNGEMTQAQLQETLKEWPFTGFPKSPLMHYDWSTGLDRIGTNEDEKILFIGDSHGRQYWNSFDSIYKQQEAQDTQTLPSILFKKEEFPPQFKRLPIKDDPSIKTVVLSYFWALRYGSETVNQYIRCCGDGPNGAIGEISIPHMTPTEMDTVDAELMTFFEELQKRDIQIYIILDNPFGEEINAQSMLNIDGLTVSPAPQKILTREEVLNRSNPIRQRVLNLAEKYDVHIIDPLAHLCADGICHAYSDDGKMMYKDYDHISLYVSRHMADYVHVILK